MRYVKAYVRENGEFFEGALVEYKTRDIMDNSSPNIELVISKDNFPSFLLAKVWVIEQRNKYNQILSDTGWMEVD